MADALALRVMQLIKHTVELDLSHFKLGSRRIAESFDGLTNHLRDMMLGYENEEVQALLEEMEELTSVMPQMQLFGGSPWKGKEGGIFLCRNSKRRLDRIIAICEHLCNIRYNTTVEDEEVMAGFDNEVEILLDQLTGTYTKRLQIISIAGMAGLGKTTLAKKLYTEPLIEYMFDFRAWTCVSQVYVKKDLLLNILSSFINDVTDDIYRMSEEHLGEKLYRKLKGCKYLVVLDDIWDYTVWNDLKFYFPDDKTGSRILFTSRDKDVGKHVPSAMPAHVLRLRTEVESWEILKKNVFRIGICPGGLKKIGLVINRKCEGLPLAIVIVAGLLKNNMSITWWEHIAASQRMVMVRDPSQYMDSLALSYNHLPPHLKPCFLFFGAFPEDYEVPVRKLKWIAHGFIHETGSRISEDVAEDFLMELVKRNLLITSRTRADGRVKTCRIHDLLHDFTLRKAEEENFISSRYGMVSSMLCYPVEVGKVLYEGGSIFNETYKFIRILDVESVPISSFPSDVIELFNLRYLAIQARDGSPQASISKLVNLQVLIISSKTNIVVPKTIWNMVNLRHLYMKSGENIIMEPCFVQVIEKDGRPSPSALASLQTLSQVSPQSCHNILTRTPNLRKLGFCGPLISRLGDLEFPNLRSMEHLQKLKLLNTFPYPDATRFCNPIMFPQKLKKLTLSNTGVNWEDMWTFSFLPNLEILSLKFQACIGERWETGDTEFRQLKVLKMHDLDIKQWVCSRDNFPRLQRLVVHRCLKLDSVPAALGKILTLEVIEVNGCRPSAYKSVMEIQKEQEREGDFLESSLYTLRLCD